MWIFAVLCFGLFEAPEYLQFRPSEAQIYLGQIRCAETQGELQFLFFPNVKVSDLNGEYVLVNNDANREKFLSLSIMQNPPNIIVGEQSEKDEIFALALHYLIGQLSQGQARETMLKSVLDNQAMKESFAMLDSHYDKPLKPGWITNYLRSGLANERYHFSSARSFPSRSSLNYFMKPFFAASFVGFCIALGAKELFMHNFLLRFTYF